MHEHDKLSAADVWVHYEKGRNSSHNLFHYIIWDRCDLLSLIWYISNRMDAAAASLLHNFYLIGCLVYAF